MRKGVAVLAALAAGAAPTAAHAAHDPAATSTYRILANPTGGDDFLFRGAIQQNAQDLSNRLFGALQVVLGGAAPQLNFVQPGDERTPAHFSATPTANVINLDPLAVEAFTNASSTAHNPAVVDMPHEMAHLRQTATVLQDLALREGGAQAFADTVTNIAASRARIPYRPGNYDADYAPYVQQVQPRGQDWILGGQFGKPPVPWP